MFSKRFIVLSLLFLFFCFYNAVATAANKDVYIYIIMMRTTFNSNLVISNDDSDHYKSLVVSFIHSNVHFSYCNLNSFFSNGSSFLVLLLSDSAKGDNLNTDCLHGFLCNANTYAAEITARGVHVKTHHKVCKWW